MERRVAQAGTVQARSTAVDTEAWNARPTQRHKALREGSCSLVELRRCLMKLTEINLQGEKYKLLTRVNMNQTYRNQTYIGEKYKLLH